MFAAFHLPALPIVAAMQAVPSLRTRPCAILPAGVAGGAKAREKLPLVAINPIAQNTGIAVGWPLNRALMRCPGLRIVERYHAIEAQLLADLCQLADSLTPDWEISAPDRVTLDLSPSGNPRDFAEIPRLPGIEVWHAWAETPDLAALGARHPQTHGRCISSGLLMDLPITALSGNFLPLLHDWGLRTLGDFMKLPRQALAERLGAEAANWHDVLHAKTCRLLRLHRPPESLAQQFDFEDPTASLEPVVFAIKRLLHTLSSRLMARHLAAGSLSIVLHLESGGTVARLLRLPEPLSDTEALLRPVQTLLDTIQLDAPVVALQLDAKSTLPVAVQREWHGKQLPQPERWAETLARLEALVGKDRVGIPVPSLAHRPDDFALKFVPLSPVSSTEMRLPETPLAVPACSIPLRRYRPARPVVAAFETRDGTPWPLALLSGEWTGEIIDRHGPFPISGDWWDESKFWQRLEWDIELAGHRLLRLAFLPPSSWQLEGIYA